MSKTRQRFLNGSRGITPPSAGIQPNPGIVFVRARHNPAYNHLEEIKRLKVLADEFIKAASFLVGRDVERARLCEELCDAEGRLMFAQRALQVFDQEERSAREVISSEVYKGARNTLAQIIAEINPSL